ncbi:MAG: ATP/GTP-binding protein [Chitinophagaceae bacterium]|nr:ATP/GTP-binding protein [Chitinophagaceae bacterium]
MKQCFFIFLAVVFCNTSIAQSLEKLWATDSVLRVPESVYFDEKNEKIYVSNIEGKGPWDKDGKGSIALLTLNGKVLNPQWITGLHAPKGMVVKKVFVDGAQGLNDITTDRMGNIFVSDSKTKKIFYIGLFKGDVKVYTEGLAGPNGLYYSDHTLYLVDAGGFYRLGKNREKILIVDGMSTDTDGIEQVDEKNFLVSCWSGVVWLINTNGQKTKLLDTKAENVNAADIGFDKRNKIVYVPTFWRNNVVAYQFKY